MKIYLGIVGSKKVQSFAKEHNCGWCLTPDNNRTISHGTYFLDNGAFTAWKNNTKWNENKFKVLVSKYPNYDFVVAPDIVCGGNESLAQSCKYIEKIPGPLYLAVQDGMSAKSVLEYIDLFDGLFVGGSIQWKFSTARMWADIAHLHGKKCHAGRVGTWEGFIHMYASGIDSVDTTTPSRHQCDFHIQKYHSHLKYQTHIDQRLADNTPLGKAKVGTKE
jgi:hypothetical protein